MEGSLTSLCRKETFPRFWAFSASGPECPVELCITSACRSALHPWHPQGWSVWHLDVTPSFNGKSIHASIVWTPKCQWILEPVGFPYCCLQLTGYRHLPSNGDSDRTHLQRLLWNEKRRHIKVRRRTVGTHKPLTKVVYNYHYSATTQQWIWHWCCLRTMTVDWLRFLFTE